MTEIAELLDASNADGGWECRCDFMCSRLFLAKAYDLTWEFLDSIQTEGILEAIGYGIPSSEDGWPKVRNGNHRIVAAILLGLYDELPTVNSYEQSDCGPSGWPVDYCIHQTDDSLYVMGDPGFAKAIVEYAKGLSDCGQPECCHYCGEYLDYNDELD